MKDRDADPLLSMSNILKATEKLDSGMLRSVTKNMYLVQKAFQKLILGKACEREICLQW